MPPVKHSEALPLIASTRIATGPANGSTRSPRALTSRGLALKRSSESRVFIVPERLAFLDEVARDPHQHRGEAAGVAAEVDHDAAGVPVLVDGFLELAIDGRHPDVEPDHAHGQAAWRLAALGLDAHEHRRKVADGDRLTGFGPALDLEIVKVAVDVLERDRHLRPGRPAKPFLRHAPGFDVFHARLSGEIGQHGDRGSVPPTDTTFHPGLTPAAWAALSRSTLLTITAPSIEPHVEADVARQVESRTSHRRRLPGINAKCDWPSRPSMSRMTPRSAAGSFAASARGRSSVRTPFQSTPFMRAIEVGVADDGPRGVERLRRRAQILRADAGRHGRDDPRQHERDAERPPHAHLMSALISAGGSNTDGGTVSYSIDSIVMTCCTPMTLFFTVVGTSRLPNFL